MVIKYFNISYTLKKHNFKKKVAMSTVIEETALSAKTQTATLKSHPKLPIN